MALISKELETLSHFLPPGTLEPVLDSMHRHGIYLQIRRERRTVLGDYRPARAGKPHTISVNGNLNPYHFLLTYLHELAHLETHIRHGRRVSPHGPEWKNAFSALMEGFLGKGYFPAELEPVIRRSLQTPAASTCSDPALYRALTAYDPHTPGMRRVEELLPGTLFRTPDERRFRVSERRRTRFLCIEEATGKRYLFPGIFEVYTE